MSPLVSNSVERSTPALDQIGLADIDQFTPEEAKQLAEQALSEQAQLRKRDFELQAERRKVRARSDQISNILPSLLAKAAE